MDLNTDENSQGNFGKQIDFWQVKEVIVYSSFAQTPNLKLSSGKISDIQMGKFDGSRDNDWYYYLLDN